jgi:hypothetical protein
VTPLGRLLENKSDLDTVARIDMLMDHTKERASTANTKNV